MPIIKDMEIALKREGMGSAHTSRLVWRISDNALPAVQAGLGQADSMPLISGALLMGLPWERATDIDGWELAARKATARSAKR
jgi:hypothetical protein